MSLTDSVDRRNAADQLGVPPDAPPADARAAFLRRLPTTGFVPPPPLCAAATVIAGQSVPGAAVAESELAEDDALRAEVAAFAQNYWSIAQMDRRRRWQDLLARAVADPLLAARVRRLEAGVDLPDAAGGSGPPRPRHVIEMIQTLFVLSPFDRAARRRELLDALPPPASAWEQAGRHVQHQLPAHAALEPALIERLTTWARRPKADARGVSRPAATWGFQTQVGLQVPQVRPAPARRRSPGWAAGLWIFVVLTAVRALTGGFQQGQRPQTPKYDFSRTIPTTPAPTFDPERWRHKPTPTPEKFDELLRGLDGKSIPPSHGPVPP